MAAQMGGPSVAERVEELPAHQVKEKKHTFAKVLKLGFRYQCIGSPVFCVCEFVFLFVCV